MPVACRHVIQITTHSYPGHHHCQTLARDAGPVTGVGESRAGKMVKLQGRGRLRKFPVFSGNVHAI